MNKLTGTILTLPKMSGNVGAKTINIGGKCYDGATFTPSVSADGIISWTNDKDLPNPEPVKIKGEKGDKGEPGKDGEDYVLTNEDKQEIAEMAAELVDVPDSGGNVDLTGYATEKYVREYAQPKGDYLTEVPEGYAKTEDIPAKPEDIGAQPVGNYLTEVPSGYATEEFVKNKIAEAELGGEEVDLSGYAQKSELPTKVSQLENDRQYINAAGAPVQSINGKTGKVQLGAADVGARPFNWIPTAQEVGALPDTYVPPNQTAAQVGADPIGTAATTVSTHNTSMDSHGDLRLELKAISDRLTAFFDSDNQTLDELSEIVAYITSNKELIDSITTSKVSVADIINNLATNVANKPLSAAQGVVLKGLIDAVSASLSDYQPKGDYALASAIPTKVSQLQNDEGYLTEHQDISGKLDADKLTEAVNDALAQAKESGEFDGEDGQRGTGLLSVTTAPSSYTTAVGGITPKYRMALSTIKTQAGVTEVLLGDTIRYSYYHYPIAYLDTSYAYFTTRVSIRGATGVSVSSVEQTTTSSADGGSNVVTVTLSDGTASTFTVQNGSKGSPGVTPQRGTDYWTPTDQQEIEAYIATELAKRNQLAPEYAESVEWLSENGDQSKLYVLPDGMIYAWMLTEKEVSSGAGYTNLLPQAKNTDRTTIYNGKGYKENTKLSGSGGGTSTAGSGKEAMCTSGFIFPVAAGDILRINGAFPVTGSNHYVVGYDADNARTGNDAVVFTANNSGGLCWTTNDSSGKYTLENNDETNPRNTTIVYTINTAKLGADVNAVRICMGMDENTIVTLNEEIKEGGGTTIVTEYAWVSTGLAFVPADYEVRIIALEEETAQNTADISALKKGSTTVIPIKTWDAPIYDANIPVFQLSAEKAAITDAEKTVAGVYAKYDALMAKHPNYITKTNLGMCSDGVTPVYRYDFREPEPHRGVTGAKEWSETKAKAIIVSGIHWEWGGIFALYNALEELADNPALFHLRRNTHLIVLPVCNPYAVANMSVRNANQVEIHRNFEVDFIYPGEAGYIEIGERSHGGTSPLSEVESQYIDNILKANTDAAFFLTCHSNQSDTVYGTGFTWASPATYYMCNMHYRLVDKLSAVWMEKYGDELAAGIADYRTENTPEWDTRLGSAYLSTTNGTETKQATKYGIQATNIEVTDAFVVHGTKANPEAALSSFTMSRGAEVYANFLLTAFGVYDHKDKKDYAPNLPWTE